MAHTPGPWTTFSLDWRMVVDANSHDVIADVRTTPDDARLIAAAPDLLEASKSLVAFLDRKFDDSYAGETMDDFIPAIRAAIAQTEI